jgi:hypothetical protein
MRLVSRGKAEVKSLKFSVGVLTIAMIVASIYTTYCAVTRYDMLIQNPRLWGLVAGIYVVTGLSVIYYLILGRAHRKMRNSF